MAITIKVTMTNIYAYEAPSFAGFGLETRYIYTMTDDEGKVYVWKTSTCLVEWIPNPDGHFIKKDGAFDPSRINKGDIIEIRATVKGETEYKGKPQTEISRVKVLNRIFKAKTWEEIQEEKRIEREQKAQEQKDSVQGEDFIWRMPYKQYKEHYADCETVVDSFERIPNRPATIEVIVREGRLKASGVRGKHFRRFRLINEKNEMLVYQAICEENAIKRAMKEYPSEKWECDRVYG